MDGGVNRAYPRPSPIFLTGRDSRSRLGQLLINFARWRVLPHSGQSQRPALRSQALEEPAA